MSRQSQFGGRNVEAGGGVRRRQRQKVHLLNLIQPVILNYAISRIGIGFSGKSKAYLTMFSW